MLCPYQGFVTLTRSSTGDRSGLGAQDGHGGSGLGWGAEKEDCLPRSGPPGRDPVPRGDHSSKHQNYYSYIRRDTEYSIHKPLEFVLEITEKSVQQLVPQAI